MTLEELNQSSAEVCKAALEKCCGSSSWTEGMNSLRPFLSKNDLLEKADLVWSRCTPSDGLEAFTHHPKIGDRENVEKKFASTQDWAGGVQKSVETAARETLLALAQGNTDYENKFGYIFIVCASGKTAEEMLTLLQNRIHHSAEEEIQIAMGEQHKITHLRLEKLLA